MPQMSDTEKQMIQRLEKLITKEVSNQFLIQLIELSGEYLNLKTIPDYAIANNMSYNGVKKFRKVNTLFNVKFVIDNE